MSHALDAAKLPALKQQAIEWLVRLRDENISDEEINAFADWLAQDYRHSEAFANAEDLFDDMVLAARHVPASLASAGDAPQADAKVVDLEQVSSTPRKRNSKNSWAPVNSWMPTVLAIAAVWLFAVILVMPQTSHPLDRLLSDYHTVTGEVREVQLADGSQMLLNTNSAVSVNYDNTKRQIILHHGQVLFTVAQDSERTFEVIADVLTVQALGTVFEVYRPDVDEVVVSVQEHAVRVNIQSKPEQQDNSAGVNVQAGQRLRYRHAGGLTGLESIELKQASAWQHGRLFFNDRPLGALIAELNRYRVGRIFLTDTQLGHLRVTGVFSLDKPDDILRSVCDVLGLQETRLSDWWILLHR